MRSSWRSRATSANHLDFSSIVLPASPGSTAAPATTPSSARTVNIIIGGKGDDALDGRDGSDTYRIGRHAGFDAHRRHRDLRHRPDRRRRRLHVDQSAASARQTASRRSAPAAGASWRSRRRCGRTHLDFVELTLPNGLSVITRRLRQRHHRRLERDDAADQRR